MPTRHLRKPLTPLQEKAWLNPEGRAWLEARVKALGRGRHLLSKKTVRTPLVRQTAYKLTHGKNALAAALRCIFFVKDERNVKLVDTGWETIHSLYNKQTADDVIATRQVPSIMRNGQAIVGCNTIAATLASLLRAATPATGKITDVKVVRTIAVQGMSLKDGSPLGMPHTVVSFKINGKKYIADAFNHGHGFFDSALVKMRGRVFVEEEKVSKVVELLKKNGRWKEALDPQAFGLEEFESFIVESHRAGASLAADLDLQIFLDNLKRRR